MNKYLKSIRIIYFLNLVSPLFILGVVSIGVPRGTIMLNDNIDIVFRYMIPLFGILFIIGGIWLFKKRLNIITKEENIETRIIKYRGAIIQKFSFIEGVALMSVVAYIITLNNLFVGYSLLALSAFISCYPTIEKIKVDLGLDYKVEIENHVNNRNINKLFNKKSWVIIPFIILMILINYSSFKELLDNKIVLPETEDTSGMVKNNIYINKYLNWTFTFPSDYSERSKSDIEKSIASGKEVLGLEVATSDNIIRLLSISNGTIHLNSDLSPISLYENISNEKEYLTFTSGQLLKANSESITIEENHIGTIQIDDKEFSFIEYLITERNQFMLLHMCKLYNDYIFNIFITYSDGDKGVELFNNLTSSKLTWE